MTYPRLLWTAQVALVSFLLPLAACSASMPPPSAAAPIAGPALANDAPAPQAPGNDGVILAKYPAPTTPGGGGPLSVPTPTTQTAKNASASDKSAAQANPDAYVVYVGDYGMTSDAEVIPGTLDRVVDIAESFGGHLAGRTDTSVKVKVPSAHFREAMTAVDKLGEVTRRSVSADDVSAEYKDLEVRLENLRAERKAQRGLPREGAEHDRYAHGRERARARRTRRDRHDQGRIRVLSDSTAFSVLGVTIAPKPKLAPLVAKAPDPPAKPRAVSLPIGWLNEVGIAPLLDLHSGS